MSTQSPKLPLGAVLFEDQVRRLRAEGRDVEYIARQVVDDAFRCGVDLRAKRHFIERFVREVSQCP